MTNQQSPATKSTSTAQNILIRVEALTVQKANQVICQMPEMSVTQGERVGITGSNGSGKTTLLRVLAGLEQNFAGLCDVPTARIERVFVHQTPFLFNGTVLDNVEFGLKARSIAKSQRRERAMSWLKRLGLTDLAHRAARSLSGGEGRRTALARACVLHPELLLLDEPLADLDPNGIDCVLQSLSHLPNSTILISSPKPLPAELVNRTIEL